MALAEAKPIGLSERGRAMGWLESLKRSLRVELGFIDVLLGPLPFR